MNLVFSARPDTGLDEWLSREYLLTNGRGGFAMSTLADCPTRKYHGLLALPEEKSGRIHLYLSKIELSLLAGHRQYDLSTNLFPESVFPEGYRRIRSVEVNPCPVTVFAIPEEGVTINKSALMPRGETAVLVRYELLEAGRPVTVKLAPFLAYREISSLTHQNADLRPRTYFEPNGFKIDPYPTLPPLFVQTSRTSMFYPSPDWWKNFEYPEERKRGYEFSEDLFCPGIFEVKLKKGEAVIVRAALDASTPRAIEASWKKETGRVARLAENRAAEDDPPEEPLHSLKLQADHFLIDNPLGIFAGFPWFADEWGRDAFISLPGLLLCRGRTTEALAFLERFAAYERFGFLPNTVSRRGEHAYNSLDTPFLFCRAAQRWLEVTGDRKAVREKLLPALVRILSAFTEGRAPGARLGEEGFLHGGSERTQLTWMDAQVDGRSVTSRHGAAVEITALFHNALRFLLDEFGADLAPEHSREFGRVAGLIEKNFEACYWNESDACLCDVYRSAADRDRSIRPNQLFAVGLPADLLPPEKARLVLETVKHHLVTPYGLRTLSPADPAFVPRYEGDQTSRDRAYHQGMVWPWLIGVFFDASKKHAADAAVLNKYFRSTFAPLWEQHPADGCLLHLAEIFSPVAPHLAGGCPAQAWSLAEALRVLEAIR